MKLVVLSNEEQYKVFTNMDLSMDEILVVSDNPGVYDLLTDHGVEFEKLEEEILPYSSQEINEWACSRALLWGELVNKEELFKGIDVDKALYLAFSFYLTSILKNYLFSNYLLSKDPDSIYSFSNITRPRFPEFNGSFFLDYFLRKGARLRGLEIKDIVIREKGRKIGKKNIKQSLRTLIQKIYPLLSNVTSKGNKIIAYGSLIHLDSVLIELKKRGFEIILFDMLFHMEQFRFCRKYGMKYILPECLGKKAFVSLTSKDKFKKSFYSSLEVMRNNKWFKFLSYDLTEWIFELLRSEDGIYFEKMEKWERISNALIQNYTPVGLIMDEDVWTIRAFMAAFFKSKNIHTFCVSHGFAPQTFEMEDKNRKFFLSKTFVNSEHERNVYSARGWDKEHVLITGSPRYDRLIETAIKSKKNNDHPKKIKILFSGAMMKELSPDQPFYSGAGYNETACHMRECISILKDAVQEIDAEVFIKPRYAGEDHVWRKELQRQDAGEKFNIIPGDTDFFKVLTQCNVMICGHWTTALIESFLLRIPALVIDKPGRPEGHSYAKYGICKIVTTAAETRQVLTDIHRTFSEGGDGVKDKDIKRKSFFNHFKDQKNTIRVVDIIVSNIESTFRTVMSGEKDKTVCL
jgi:hypothetical protein